MEHQNVLINIYEKVSVNVQIFSRVTKVFVRRCYTILLYHYT